MNRKNSAIIICGPTASGKSSFALKLAMERGGAIINADSMQIYNCLNLITASPSLANKTHVPHFLYNFIDPTSHYSVANFVDDARKIIKECTAQNMTPIITGGTGMYINALMNGISSIPEIDQSHRDEIIHIAKNHRIEILYHKLKEIDPEAASKLNMQDSQRIIRAYEVKSFTGKSILEFQLKNSPPILKDFAVTTYYIKPERTVLYKMCEKRFLSITNNGGVKEVAEFIAQYPGLETGPAKALGVRELKAYIENHITREEAIKLSQIKTRQYAKRQLTWFNNQLSWEHHILVSPELNDT